MIQAVPARILIVDDEAAQMEALRDTLADQGYQVVACASGPAALLALREAPFDLLLADLMMPGMDGIELLRAALQVDAMLVGVIMTGAGTIETAVQAMQSGALDYILKPFKLSAILPVLGRALAVRQLRVDNALLEQRVRQRTAELELANAELDAFSRTVSHDLRNPLHTVIGFSNLLRAKFGSQMPDQARAWVEQIERTAERMNLLIEDLLRLAHLGRVALRPEVIDLNVLVQSVAEELKPSLGERPAALRIDLLPQVTADPSLLRQVFVNLLSNAYKFTRKTPQALIEVGCSIIDNEQVLYVRDNGTGFDMAHAQKLFGVFERLHSSQEFEGTGVGLSTVQRIVQRHGGRIWAEAAPGRGATFFLTLRAAPG